jgi:hypothetical protein
MEDKCKDIQENIPVMEEQADFVEPSPEKVE